MPQEKTGQRVRSIAGYRMPKSVHTRMKKNDPSRLICPFCEEEIKTGELVHKNASAHKIYHEKCWSKNIVLY